MTLSRIRSFDGAVAIITGGGSATGASLDQELARRGCEIVLADYPIDGVKQVATEIQAAGGTATAAEIDVTDSWNVEALIYATIRRTGRLDYMFNYAGTGLCSTAFGRKIEDWDTMIERNLRGIIYGVRAAYQVMLVQGFGHIVNIAPIIDVFPVSENKSYAITRHAIIGFSNAMRLEAASAGIRIRLSARILLGLPL
ncbi:SDR family oxidoreductase [Pelosinus baikalensis]|uniref:SDR family oxidoreductase n=1 Tax=Pelosinus baikalensis TaxID=2892015 RepID=A0ABS8HVE7_9FIRM|nr:SDR family NAD(P)-dependent oxidoreductase [Pelosinus baikalensis]MCC5466902.1 SDR family oxidoreductase [Pelosinus baikalensis]